jgi:hypothetical protein
MNRKVLLEEKRTILLANCEAERHLPPGLAFRAVP